MKDLKNKGQMEQVLWDNKTLSISQKDYANVYTNLVHSYSFKNNQIQNVLAYIPSNLSVKEEVLEDGTLKKEIVLTNQGTSIGETFIDSFEDIELYEEDNTLSEIISQKMNSYNKSRIVGMLNTDSDTVKRAQGAFEEEDNNSEEVKNAQDKIRGVKEYVDAAAQGVSMYNTDILDMIEESMYYPYSGIAAIYHNYIPEGERSVQDELVTRWVRFNTFTFDSDITTGDVDKADWAIVTERISFNSFKERVKSGEYSGIKHTLKDEELLNIWNTETNYDFALRNFPEQAISKNTTLRQEGFYQKIETVKKNKYEYVTPNLYGVIDYMYQKNMEGGYNLYVFLNGNYISMLKIDKKIDQLPVVLFSERSSIRKDIHYKGNIGFKLLSSQKSILKANVLKEVSLKEVSPFVTIKYVDDEGEMDKASEIETVETLANTVTMLTLYSNNPNAANNSTRFVDGGQFYGSYLNMWDQQIQTIKVNMREKAGITEFAQGTASHSIESQSGINQMAVTGLKNEYDVVKAHAKSIKDFMIMVGFSELAVLYGEQAELESISDVSLTDVIFAFEDIFKINLESAYQEEFTNGLIQTLIVPLAAQSGAIQQVLPLIKELPVTETFKDGIDKMASEMKAAQEAQQQQMIEQQQAEEERAKGEEAAAEAEAQSQEQNTVKTGKGEDSGKEEKKTQKTESSKDKADKKVNEQKKTEETKKSTRSSQKKSKE